MIAVIVLVTLVVPMLVVVAAFTVAMSVFLAMMLSLRVIVGVPIVLHEIDAPAARVILGTMTVPMFLVPRRNVQVDRLGVGVLRDGLNDNRLGVEHRRSRRVADNHLPVEPGLVDPQRDTYVLRDPRRGHHRSQDARCHPLHG